MKILALVLVTSGVFAQQSVYVPGHSEVLNAINRARQWASDQGRGPGLTLPDDSCIKKEADPFVVYMVNGLRKGFNGESRGNPGWGLVKKINNADGSETFKQDVIAFKDTNGKVHYFDFILGACSPGVIPGIDALQEVELGGGDSEYIVWTDAPLDPLPKPATARRKSRGPSSSKKP